LAGIGDAGFLVEVDEGWRDGERVDLERHAFFVQFVRDNFCDELLFEPGDVGEFDADAGVVKPIERFAREREKIFVRQLDLEAKIIADVEVLFPTGKAAADRDLLKLRRLPLAVFKLNRRRYIERESDVLSLIYRHLPPVKFNIRSKEDCDYSTLLSPTATNIYNLGKEQT